MVTESLEHVVLANESSQLQSSYEAAALLIEFELKKILIDKMDKSESYLTTPEHRECYDGLIKSYELDKNLLSTYDKVYSLKRIEKTMIKMITCLIFSLLYPDQGLKKRKTSKHAEPSKDRLILHKVEGNLGVDDGRTQERARTPQQGQSKLVMTLAVMCDNLKNLLIDLLSTPKKTDWTKQPEGGNYPFDLTNPFPLVMSENRQKATREQRKTFYGYARGLESNHDVYSTKHILAVTRVEKRLTNLSGDDVSDFAIALRMFTRSMVIQKRVEDLQLGVKVTRRRSTSPSQKLPDLVLEKGTYTLHIKTLKDSFMLTAKGETEYPHEVPAKEKMEFLGKKRAHIMIKAIDKLLKQRRMMRSLEKSFGGRHYETDLRLLQ
ncbi:hypothetical protein Tco_0587809 [Tanacetum coccineum]